MSKGFSSCGCPVMICDKCEIEMDLKFPYQDPHVYICPECGCKYPPDGKKPWSVS